MFKKLLLLILPISIFAQIQLPETEVFDLLTADTWNISYNISPEGERVEHDDPDKIRESWVKFNKDGSYEMPGGNMGGKTIGKWSYDQATSAIHFIEGRSRYRAIVDEISDLGMLLNYIDNGGFKIGLIHHIYIPTEKSVETLTEIITAGTWQILSQKFDQIEDKTAAENLEETWFKFNTDHTYQRSEVIGEEVLLREGTWFIDEEFKLNLDASEMDIFSIVGDHSRLILTSTTDGFKIIECRKAK